MLHTQKNVVDYILETGCQDMYIFSLDLVSGYNLALAGNRFVPLQKVYVSVQNLSPVFIKYNKSGSALLSSTIPYSKFGFSRLVLHRDFNDAVLAYQAAISKAFSHLDNEISKINELKDRFSDSLSLAIEKEG